jgi:hypothetical protein
MSAVSEAPAAVEPVAPATGWRERLRVPGEIAAVLGVALTVFLLVRPMLFKHEFVGFDWYAHLWYIWHQEGAIQDNWVPSLYSFNGTGIFDPHFAFYGGTLYVVAALISLVVGHVAAFALTWIGAFAMAHGGFYWMARMAGVGRVASHIPGVLFISSPWWLSSIYAWGSWGQAVAISSLVLLLAAVISILRSDELRLGPATALAFSTTLYTGSHNLTMAWASTLVVVAGVVVLAVVPGARRLVFQRRGLKRLALIMVPAFLVNAWFFLPDVAYQAQTAIAANADFAEGLVRTSMFFVTPDHLFSLSNENGLPGFTHQSAQLPLLALGWAVVAFVLFRPRLRSPFLWLGLILFGLMAGVWQLMTHIEWIVGLPSPYDHIQAPYRFEAYIELGLSGLVVCALALAARTRGWRRYWVVATLPILVVVVLQGKALVDEGLPAAQVSPPWSDPRPYYSVDEPPYGAADYVDSRIPSVNPDPTMPRVVFSAAKAQKDGRVSAVIDASPGQSVLSNLKAATWLIDVKGAHIFAQDGAGNAVLQIDDGAQPGAARITVSAKSPPPVVIGRILSILALLWLAAGAVLITLRRRDVVHHTA